MSFHVAVNTLLANSFAHVCHGIVKFLRRFRGTTSYSLRDCVSTWWCGQLDLVNYATMEKHLVKKRKRQNSLLLNEEMYISTQTMKEIFQGSMARMSPTMLPLFCDNFSVSKQAFRATKIVASTTTKKRGHLE